MAFDPTGEEFHAVGARAQSLTTYRQLLSDRDGKIATLRATSGPSGDLWKRLEVDLSKAEAQKDGIAAKLGRPVEGSQSSGPAYLLPAALLAGLEAFMNKFLLDNALQLPNIFTYFVSAVITFAMLSLAYTAGMMLRQCRGEYSEEVHWWRIAVPVLVILPLIFSFIGLLTVARAALETSTAINIGIFAEIKRQISTIGPWQSLMIALSDTNALIVAAMNTISVAVAFFAPFIRLDPDKDYQSAYNQYKKISLKLERMGKDYAAELERVSNKFSPRLSKAVANYGTHNARVVAAKSSRGAAITDDDRYDLTKEDVMLARARDELEVRAKVSKPSAAVDARAEEASSVSMLTRERRV